MKKRQQIPEELDTWTVGPSVCGRFDGAKDACHACVAKGRFRAWICFTRPSGKVRAGMNTYEQIQAAANAAGGGAKT